MDYFDKLAKQIALYVFGAMVISSVITAVITWFCLYLFPTLPAALVIIGALAVGLISAFFASRVVAEYILEPLRVLWKAILHVSPGQHEVSPPDLEKIRIGRELVTSLALQVYQLASSTPSETKASEQTTSKTMIDHANILQTFPLPIFVMNKDRIIVFANPAAAAYIGKTLQEIIGINLYSVLDLAFSEGETFDQWLTKSRTSKVTSEKLWSHVRLSNGEQNGDKQLDMAAYYNKDSTDNAETIIALFDKTAEYAKNDDGMSFVAIAVHELRTPLTILRGYIEVFQDEVSGTLDPEMADFLRKMQASAQQLSSFVSNILHVARVEADQLYLQLHEEKWEAMLTSIVKDMALRAHVRDKKIQLSIQPNLPAAAVDTVGMYEVISNLIDNAIKYSGKSNRIIVRSYLRDDGLIETTVQDFGIGIPTSIIGNLFEKFYRNHRSRSSVGGTGLGLFLSKTIVDAHGGQIWVKSKEGEGSVFGFSLLPYAKLASEQKNTDNKDIKRVAHGWIKNHSFYKR